MTPYHRIVMKVNVLIYMKVLVNPHQNHYISSHSSYATSLRYGGKILTLPIFLSL